MIDIRVGDAFDLVKSIPSGSIQCVITSPPYFGLRNYGDVEGLGLEKTLADYVDSMVDFFDLLRRPLADDGVVWLNIADAHTAHTAHNGDRNGLAGSTLNGGLDHGRGANVGERATIAKKASTGLQEKDLIPTSWSVALALQKSGWILRNCVIWFKTNARPESARDRTGKDFEYLFMLVKTGDYYFDSTSIMVPAIKGGFRNMRSVWAIPTASSRQAHFAVMPERLVEPCVLSSSREGDIVLDPFAGSGTVGAVALKHGRRFIGFDQNADYASIAGQRVWAAKGEEMEQEA